MGNQLIRPSGVRNLWEDTNIQKWVSTSNLKGEVDVESYGMTATAGYNKPNVCVFHDSYGGSAPRFGGGRSGPPPSGKFGNPGDRLRKRHWNLDELPKFEKNFYKEHPEVTRRSMVSQLLNC